MGSKTFKHTSFERRRDLVQRMQQKSCYPHGVDEMGNAYCPWCYQDGFPWPTFDLDVQYSLKWDAPNEILEAAEVCVPCAMRLEALGMLIPTGGGHDGIGRECI